MTKIFFLLCNKMGNSHRAKEAHIAHSRSSQSEQRIRFILPEAPGGTLLGIVGGGVLPGSPHPDPISDPKMSFFTPVFRTGL